MMRLIMSLAACFAFAALTVGCSGSIGAPARSTCPLIAEPLALQILYPEYNATGVPDDASVIVYSPTGAYDGSSPIPLALGIGTASPVALRATAVPNPGPTPAEMPTADATEYAAALPPLRAATNYTIYAVLTYANCGETSTGKSVVSAFTTQ